MDASSEKIQDFLLAIGQKRGMPDFFARFEQVEISSGVLTLHLDVIEVDKKRPTIVFMPGTNAYAILYGEFLSALADEGYNIVGFDPRGHGRSGGLRGSYTVPELMADYRAAIKYARKRFGDPVVVSGSSQGGFTAFYIAAEGAPIAGAICHNIADLGDPRSIELTAKPALSRMLKPLLLRAARLFPEFRVPMTFYIDLAGEPIRALGNSKDLLYTGPMLTPYIRLKGMVSLASEPLPCPVSQIETPIMVIHGEKDIIFPKDYIEYIYQRLACRKRLKIYPDCHHYIVFDHVDKILPDIVSWLEEICG